MQSKMSLSFEERIYLRSSSDNFLKHLATIKPRFPGLKLTAALVEEFFEAINEIRPEQTFWIQPAPALYFIRAIIWWSGTAEIPIEPSKIKLLGKLFTIIEHEFVQHSLADIMEEFGDDDA